MNLTQPLPRPLRTLIRVLVPLAALTALSGCSPEQVALLSSINEIRSAHGLHSLAPSPHAMEKAQRWAERMAAEEHLRHSVLSDGMPAGFLIIGENVGRGPSVAPIEAALMDSPSHRANILDPRFRWAGTGHAVSADGVLYVVQIFADY